MTSVECSGLISKSVETRARIFRDKLRANGAPLIAYFRASDFEADAVLRVEDFEKAIHHFGINAPTDVMEILLPSSIVMGMAPSRY